MALQELESKTGKKSLSDLSVNKIFRIYWSKFEFNIFSKKIFITETIIVLFTIAGIIVMDAVTRNKGDEWNGYVLFIIATIILLGLFTYIYKKTDIRYGTLAVLIIIKLLLLFIIVPLCIIIYLAGVFDAASSNRYVVVKRY